MPHHVSVPGEARPDPTPSGWPAEPSATLDGDRVRLEPLAPAHGPDLRRAAADPEVWRWIEPSVAERPGGFDRWLEVALAESAAGREVAFATIDRRAGRAVGSTRLLALRPHDRVVEIGWTWLGREAWRTGINAEAKLLLLAHAFETLGCRRVELKTDARNGAQFEGIFRKHRLVPIPRDTAWYSILDDEWPAVRERLRARSAGRPPRP